MTAKASTQRGEIEQAKRLPYKELAKQTLKEAKSDDIQGIASEIAYHAIFAIPPFIIFLVTLAALVNLFTDVPVVENIQRLINQYAAPDLRGLLNSLVQNALQRVSGGAVSFGVVAAAVVALWSGSNGVASIMKAFNRAYDVEETRGFVKTRAISVGLTVLIAVLVNLAFAASVFGGAIGRLIAGRLGLGRAFDLAWNILRWPASVVFIMFLLAILFYLGPNVKQQFKWISPGSVVATLLWLLVAIGFRIYLLVSNPGSAYGALGSVVVFLFFLYLSALAFLVGAEVNAVLGRRFDPETIRDLAEHPEKVETPEDQEEARRHLRELRRRRRAGA
ncbi:MAG: YihY/virulence factor BrkB family protein [Thermomicrobiaceae bacterium]|nr:YihY/virulence factor BrkB family protein [Thermomicrobiaceae bacterium]